MNYILNFLECITKYNLKVCQKQKFRLPGCPNVALKSSTQSAFARKGESTIPLDNLFHHLTALMLMNFFLTCNLNLSFCSLKPLVLILPLQPLITSPSSSFIMVSPRKTGKHCWYSPRISPVPAGCPTPFCFVFKPSTIHTAF